MWDLYRREVISEKVDIWVSAKHMNMNMWSLGIRMHIFEC